MGCISGQNGRAIWGGVRSLSASLHKKEKKNVRVWSTGLACSVPQHNMEKFNRRFGRFGTFAQQEILPCMCGLTKYCGSCEDAARKGDKYVISVATQVAISRRVLQRYKLALRGRQEVEGRRTGSTSNSSTPMIWGCRVSMHSRTRSAFEYRHSV